MRHRFGTVWENDRERCHSEVGAPARSDQGSLVMLRNTSGRPGTETSNSVLELVVTALPETIPEHN
jgi:hypothetical protein